MKRGVEDERQRDRVRHLYFTLGLCSIRAGRVII
jgi:hypothetical protein